MLLVGLAVYFLSREDPLLYALASAALVPALYLLGRRQGIAPADVLPRQSPHIAADQSKGPAWIPVVVVLGCAVWLIVYSPIIGLLIIAIALLIAILAVVTR